MPTQLRILIVDDEPERSKGWEEQIRRLGVAEVSVDALDLITSRTMIEAADKRRRAARDNQDPFDANIACALDDVDVLIVDYDLQELVAAGQWSTGLWVAMLARAFSRVKLVVLINQFGTNMFDLTLSKGVKSRADFDVGSAQLLNPAPWDRTRIDGYAPWSWGDGILKAVARLDDAVAWIRQRLDKPVLEELGFTANVGGGDNHISQELWQECITHPDRTFRDMVGDAEFLTLKDREFIKQFDESCARVAAAIVSHWLDRWVIPANDVLIDLPHLASANPWLLVNTKDVSAWQATTSVEPDGFDVFLPEVKKYSFESGFPTSRPTVWRRKVAAAQDLAEPCGFTYDDFPDLVFCEDTSRFIEFADAQSFSCRLPSGDPQRFVANREKITPLQQGYVLTDVSYEPSVLFAI